MNIFNNNGQMIIWFVSLLGYFQNNQNLIIRFLILRLLQFVKEDQNKNILLVNSILAILNNYYVLNMDINSFEHIQQAIPLANFCPSQLESSKTSDDSQYSNQVEDELKEYLQSQCCSQKFKVQKELYSAQQTKVLLVVDECTKECLVAKITEVPQMNTSASIHLIHETQFYTKLQKAKINHLTKIVKSSVINNKFTRIMKLACRGDICHLVFNITYNCTREQKMQRLKIAKNILWQLIKAVEQVHTLGFAHRDIKLDNILVDHEGKILLSDFGLVAPFGTIDDSICGTPQYMAPERLSKKRLTTPVDASIDLWSLGIVAYELLMGYTPYGYDEDNIDGLLENIYGGYTSFDEQYPSYCKSFIFSLLQTNPKRRMIIQKIKQHQFFNDVEQAPLTARRCRCADNL